MVSLLTLKLYNTLEGTNENAVYRYAVFVNDTQIVEGEFSGHNRNDGWAELVRGIAQHHLTKYALDGGTGCAPGGVSTPEFLSAGEVDTHHRQ